MAQLINFIEKVLQSAEQLVQDTNVSMGDVSGIERLALALNVTSVTAAAKSFATTDVDTTADTITITAHGFLTGEKGQFTTTGTLPAGLSLLTNYWLVKVNANTIKVASSLSNANAGTIIDLTDVGSGTHTFTPTALSASVKIQKSLDNVNWRDETAVAGEDVVSSAISATGLIWLEKNKPKGRYYRLVYSIAAGNIVLTTNFLGKGLN